MAGQLEMRPRNSAEFVESSILEAVVPSYSECDLQDEIESWDGSNEDENTSVLPFLAQRQFLLFGGFRIRSFIMPALTYSQAHR